MSRWTVPTLSAMTEQQILDVCAYHMLSNGGAPRDLLLKPESRPFNKWRSWNYFVRQKRAPRHASQLIADIEAVHRHAEPDTWPTELQRIATLYNLKEPTL